MTPAQASGQPNFVTDVPIQGPTDPGMRAGSCWWADNRVFPYIGTGGCVGPAAKGGCDGAIPKWTSNSLCPANQGPGSGYVAGISFGGVGMPGFALGAAGDPEIYSKLSADQQGWVAAALSKLNDNIVKQSGTTCPGWAPAIGPATTCFQGWYNLNYGAPKGPANPLRTDGVFDEETLCALLGITAAFPTDFPAAFPDPAKAHCQPGATKSAATVSPAAATPASPAVPATPAAPAASSPAAAVTPAAITPPTAKKPLSAEAKFGIAAAGVTALGGLIFVATRKK